MKIQGLDDPVFGLPSMFTSQTEELLSFRLYIFGIHFHQHHIAGVGGNV